MKYLPDKREIILNRELNKLDRFVIDFCSLLEKYTKYVIVSGYVSIVLGRSRATEDVDLLVPRMEFSNFVAMFNNFLNKGYDCINTTNPKEAFEMLDETAIRFFKQGNPLPNIEFKFIKNDLDEYSFENRLKLVLNEGTIFISPLELQIAYKLYLSSEKADKDIEDARHLYKIFQDKINKEALAIFIRKLNVEKRFKELE
jgi:hypothetical protein